MTLRVAATVAYVLSGSLLADPSFPLGPPSSAQHEPVCQELPARQCSSEISFDRQTRTVTIAVSVHDPRGDLIPNLRRENFVVYDGGIKQTTARVDVEHSPVTLAVLLEAGGRYQQLNGFLRSEIPFVTRPLLDALIRDDKLAVLAYSDRLETLIDFKQPGLSLDPVIDRLGSRGFSETNLYDSLIELLNRMADVHARKAVLLVSTGIDTFSRATFDDVLHAAGESATPVYFIGLGDRARRLIGTTGPLAKIDLKRAEDQLETLARVSGGRAYLKDATSDLPGIYDDMMEHLRVRYVITYISSNPADTGVARSVRVMLANPATRDPRRLVDASGKAGAARVIVRGSYTP